MSVLGNGFVASNNINDYDGEVLSFLLVFLRDKFPGCLIELYPYDSITVCRRLGPDRAYIGVVLSIKETKVTLHRLSWLDSGLSINLVNPTSLEEIVVYIENNLHPD